MDSQRPSVEEVFFQAVQKDSADRPAFLDATCADRTVRTRVEALLQAHDSAGNFLESPAVQPAPLAGRQNLHAHAGDAFSPWPAQESAAAHETLDFLDRCDTPNRLGLLAHYEILEILGRGGMGIVLRGLDVKLNRVVAIKVLAPELAANAMARQRFLREAQAAAAVSHDHVVAIHAVDEFKGLPYLVMEYVSGSSLQQKIDGGGPLQLAQILRIGTQTASGLAAAHAQGLVQTAGEVAEVLSRYLAHLQHDPLTPFEDAGQTQPVAIREQRPDGSGEKNGRPEHRAARSRLSWPLLVGAAVLLVGLVVLAALEGARITNLTRRAEPRVTSANQEADPAPMTSRAVAGGSTTHPPGAADRPVKVFILAGDSNMAGRATAALLKYQANQAQTKQRFQHLIHDGEWVVREDVWIKYFKRKGNLTVGFGQEPDRFGPELEFGHVVGDYFDEQVLLIKTSWGGNTLNRDLRSPSSGLPPKEVLEQVRKELQKFKANATLADAERTYGALYREMLKEVRETLADLGEHFPSYRGQGFELAGFVYFSGWNDMLEANPFYAEQLANLIRDVRGDLKAPNLPFVIGQLGVEPDGVKPGTNDGNFRIAQAAVPPLPEFKGNVKLVETDPFWDREANAVLKKGLQNQNQKDEWDKVGSDAGYHYLGSAKTFCAIGKAFGEAILELHRSGAKN